MGQCINGPSKICERQPLKKVKGCLPQILHGQFLNTLSHIEVNTVLIQNLFYMSLWAKPLTLFSDLHVQILAALVHTQ